MTFLRTPPSALLLASALLLPASAAAQANNSQFISQSVATSMAAGQTQAVSVTFRNTGTSTWTQAGNYRLGSQNPQDNLTWGFGRVLLAASESIAPTQQKTFTFNITAPSTPGSYNFQWRMLKEGAEWFGEYSTNVVINVTSPTPGAQFISQVVPATMVTGSTTSVSITMKNTGATTWTQAGNYRLGSQNPQDNLTWGIGRIALGASSVLPNQQKTFTFNVTAPATPGTYNFQWRMVQDGGFGWFGQFTPNVVVTVSAAGANCPAANHADTLPDDTALQCLLNRGGRIQLAPGAPGYYIASGLVMNQNSTYLTSSQAPVKATLIAHQSLNSALLQNQGRSFLTIEHILFDGNKAARRGVVVVCQGWRIGGTNISLIGGTGHVVRNIESSRALCGASVGLSGGQFEVANNLLRDNGYPNPSYAGEEPWADGITAGLCDGGWIHDNTVENSTDVGIITGGGSNCVIENNTIRQTNVKAFAGLGIVNFAGEGNGIHTGSRFQGNTITSGLNFLESGIAVGAHPWNPAQATSGGEVKFNTVSGAIVNLLVDGYSNGTVDNNTLSAPQGSVGNCSARNFTVAHTTNTCLQCGWTVRQWHNGSCAGTGEVIQSNCHVCP